MRSLSRCSVTWMLNKMKVLAVGDLHGKDCWKKIDPAVYDHVVFVGDYVDSLDLPGGKMRDNLSEVIDFKKEHPEKITLLLGNHDIQYSEYPDYHCSGFNARMQKDYTELFRENKSLFRVAVQFGDYLFTHAGLSYGFVKHNLKPWRDQIIEKSINVADLLNRLQDSDQQEILHTVSEVRGGIEPYGGITWADFSETSTDLLPGYHQVVGHTRQREITKVEKGDASITYIDVLNTVEEFYEGEFD